jgi:hypothetical protein
VPDFGAFKQTASDHGHAPETTPAGSGDPFETYGDEGQPPAGGGPPPPEDDDLPF